MMTVKKAKPKPPLRPHDAEVWIGQTLGHREIKVYIRGYLQNGKARNWVEAGGGATYTNVLRAGRFRQKRFDDYSAAEKWTADLFPTAEIFLECLSWHTGHQSEAKKDQPPPEFIKQIILPWQAASDPSPVPSMREGSNSEPHISRGGFQKPALTPISAHPPKASSGATSQPDAEARRQAADRRVAAHFALVRRFVQKAEAAHLSCQQSQFADALCNGNIFEMKTLEDDDISQIRAVIGQLYHYLFIHREVPGYETPGLYVVFDRSINDDIMRFLVDTAEIGVVWLVGAAFDADANTKAKLPWLCTRTQL